MFNVFPQLLTFSLLAPFILRVAVGMFFLKTGLNHLKVNRHTSEEIALAEDVNAKSGAYVVWSVAGIEALAGLALILGVLTQIAALLLSLLIVAGIYLREKHPIVFSVNRTLYVILLAICISLLFSGAGFLAIDMPL